MTSKLASLLVQDGRVSAKRMADAFQRQVIFGGTLDTILLEMGLVEPALLLDYLARATDLPAADEAPSADAAAAVRDGFSAPVVERFHAVPLGIGAGGRLKVMVIDLPDRENPAELGAAIGRPVEAHIGPEYRLHQAVEKLFGVALPPRFAKLAAKLAGGPAKAKPAARGPSLFSGRAAPAKAAAADKSAAVAAPARAAAPAPLHPAAAAAPSTSTRAATPAPVNPPPASSTAPRTSTPAAFARPPAASARASTPAPLAGGPTTLSRFSPPVSREPGDTAPGARPTASPFAAPQQEQPRPGAPRPASTLSGFAPVTGSGGQPSPSGGTPQDSLHRFRSASDVVHTIAPPPPAAPAHVGAPEAPTATARLDDFVVPRNAARAFDDERVSESEVAPASVVPLPFAEGLAALQSAVDRDTVFEIVCRMARASFRFAALFVVHGEAATLTMALDAAFLDRSSLRASEVSLSIPSPLRTAVQTLSPFIGRLGDEDVLGETLAFLGRRVPVAGALVPVVLRGRCVAVLYVDDGERVVGADEVADLVQIAADGAAAFLRIIQAQKKGGPAAAPAPEEPVPLTRPKGSASKQKAPASRARSSDQPAPAAPVAAVAPVAPVPIDHVEADRLLQLVEQEDPTAGPAAASALAAAGATAVRVVAERFPGLLRFAHRKPSAVGLPLGEHGPLLALAARLGAPMVELMIERLSDASPDIRFYAALVLAELRAESSVGALGQHLFDPDAAVRRAAGFALSRQAPSQALGKLLDQIREELTSDDLARQRAAASAAGELRDVAAVPNLVDMLTHRDMEVVDLAHRALVIITKQDFGTARWRWRSWWEKARAESRSEWLIAGLEQTSVEARRSAIDELSVIGTDRLGFHARLSRLERDDTQRRFTEWLEHNPDALDEGRGE